MESGLHLLQLLLHLLAVLQYALEVSLMQHTQISFSTVAGRTAREMTS